MFLYRNTISYVKGKMIKLYKKIESYDDTKLFFKKMRWFLIAKSLLKKNNENRYAIGTRKCSQDCTKTSLMSLKLSLNLLTNWYHYSFRNSAGLFRTVAMFYLFLLDRSAFPAFSTILKSIQQIKGGAKWKYRKPSNRIKSITGLVQKIKYTEKLWFSFHLLIRLFWR